MSELTLPLHIDAEGVRIQVRLTPNAAADCIEGLAKTADGIHLKARVTSPPADGAANRALEKLIAKWLCVPKSSVAISTGQKSRLKTLFVSGEREDIIARLTIRLGTTSVSATKCKQQGTG